MDSLTSIEDLPPEMIGELFRNLHLMDLAVCSLVNKRWHSIYTAFKIHRLVVIEKSELEFTKWDHLDQNHPERRVESKELLQLNLFKRLVDRPLLSNLKHLALCNRSSKVLEIDLNELNRFSQLMNLEIKGRLGREAVYLNLPRLKVLAFHNFNDRCPISIDCPELNVLVYGERQEECLLEVKHPETIRKLETDMFDAKLTLFKSVECLVTREFKVISETTLQSLLRLNELHYNARIQNTFRVFSNEVGTFARVQRVLNEFLENVKRLRGSNFRFIFANLQLTKENLNQIDFGVKVKEARNGRGREEVTDEHFYLKNYQLIDRNATLDFIKDLNYNHLMSIMAEGIPGCFFRKFSQIESVEANTVQNEHHFLEFLKSLKSLKNLHLFGLPLSQEFYDQLPVTANSLIKLELGGDYELQMNFDFIAEFSCFSKLSIYPELSKESFPSLIRSLGTLKNASFAFSWRGDMVSIRKRENLIRVSNLAGGKLKSSNRDEIIKFLLANDRSPSD